MTRYYLTGLKEKRKKKKSNVDLQVKRKNAILNWDFKVLAVRKIVGWLVHADRHFHSYIQCNVKIK